MSSPVRVEHDGRGVSTVTLDSPETLNALDARSVTGLHAALDEIRADRQCRAVVLTATGRAFCAGYNLKGYGDEAERVARSGEPLSRLDRQTEIAELILRLHELRQPVIAAVQGAAVGGGLSLVCACDVRIASTEAFFAAAFITSGTSGCDLGVSWLLPRIVGAGRAHEYLLTGRRFDAAEALSAGLLARTVEPDGLLAEAQHTAALIASHAPASVELTKAGMWTALEIDSLRATIELENRQQVLASLTDDAAEATTAFLEKRSAHFRRR